jgi:hypothetical protein
MALLEHGKDWIGKGGIGASDWERKAASSWLLLHFRFFDALKSPVIAEAAIRIIGGDHSVSERRSFVYVKGTSSGS